MSGCVFTYVFILCDGPFHQSHVRWFTDGHVDSRMRIVDSGREKAKHLIGFSSISVVAEQQMQFQPSKIGISDLCILALPPSIGIRLVISIEGQKMYTSLSNSLLTCNCENWAASLLHGCERLFIV